MLCVGLKEEVEGGIKPQTHSESRLCPPRINSQTVITQQQIYKK